ncbi:MAG: LytTR family DNA-binding domain-containing protein [Bacteroidota bacterium]|jgi:DNA-binding LytR/AlgR family response regulator
MKILIVEDEHLAAKRLEKLVLSIKTDAEIVGKTDSVESTVDWLNEHGMPDLFFMDIQLADGLSFTIFDKITINKPVIFTTAFDEYALKAFKVNSIDYLLKPINENELKNALIKYEKTQIQKPNENSFAEILKQLTQKNTFKNRFLVNKSDAIIPLHIASICWFKAEDKMVFIYTKDLQKHIISQSLEEISAELDPGLFFRVNRSYIIQRNCIEKANYHFNGKLKLQVNPANNEDIMVSRDKANAFKEWWVK